MGEPIFKYCGLRLERCDDLEPGGLQIFIQDDYEESEYLSPKHAEALCRALAAHLGMEIAPKGWSSAAGVGLSTRAEPAEAPSCDTATEPEP